VSYCLALLPSSDGRVDGKELLKQGFGWVEMECVGGIVLNFKAGASCSQAKSGYLMDQV
jgi:hypothetical protein